MSRSAAIVSCAEDRNFELVLEGSTNISSPEEKMTRMP